MAIENARLYEQAERLAALEERQRITRDMHDGLAQRLSALGLEFDQAVEQIDTASTGPVLQTIEMARFSLENASTEVRRAIANLQEDSLYPKTIQDQLHELVRQQSQAGDASIRWQVELEGSFHLSPDDSRQLVGIAHEALANARRHAAANRIRV